MHLLCLNQQRKKYTEKWNTEIQTARGKATNIFQVITLRVQAK